jgi:glycosyltransferase involved in cell wall biosynthesis
MATVLRWFIEWNRSVARWERGLIARIVPGCATDGPRDFQEHVLPGLLKPGQRVLDVGGGKNPAISLQRKQELCLHVVGLDVSEAELLQAPPGTYDVIVTGDVASVSIPGDYDLIFSRSVLEHVAEPRAAMANLAGVLAPGGVMAHVMPCRNAPFAILNRWLGPPAADARSPAGSPRILHVSKRVPDRKATHAGGVISGYYFDAMTRWSVCDLVALQTPSDNDVKLNGARTVHLVRSTVDEQDAATVLGLVARARAYVKLGACALLNARRNQPDIVLVEWSALGPIGMMLRLLCRQRIVLICHDLYYDRLGADISTGAAPRWAPALLRGIRALELAGVRAALGVICFDYRTKALIERDAGVSNVLVLPPVFNVFARDSREKDGMMLFWGNMSRSVNARSAAWFVDHVLPQIVDKVPDAHLVIAGADPPPELRARESQHVSVTGFVEDPSAVVGAAQVMVVPLRSGAGIKIKVLEGLASGIPVVANGVAMQGIRGVDGEHYLHAETASEFASCVIRLLQSAPLRAQLASNGRALIAEHFRRDSAAEDQEAFLRSVAASPRPNRCGGVFPVRRRRGTSSSELRS